MGIRLFCNETYRNLDLVHNCELEVFYILFHYGQMDNIVHNNNC